MNSPLRDESHAPCQRQRRCKTGAVVDFIDPQWFPIFNIADIAINVGALLLIINSIVTARTHPRDDSTEPVADDAGSST